MFLMNVLCPKIKKKQTSMHCVILQQYLKKIIPTTPWTFTVRL